MIYRGLADLILILHFCFVLFVVFGGLLVLYKRSAMRFHLPALVWGILVEFLQLPCPLTFLENYLRQLGGDAGYDGGFIEHYVLMILYWDISTSVQMLLGVCLVAVNLVVYAFVFQSRKLRGGY